MSSRRDVPGKRLSRTIWSSFNKEMMSHLCDSTVAGPTARRDNVVASKCEYPPFRYPAFKGSPTGRRVKQVRFGKLAFLQLNGEESFFEPKMLVFGHFALCFQRETGKMALWPGNRAYFCVFRGIRQIGLSC